MASKKRKKDPQPSEGCWWTHESPEDVISSLLHPYSVDDFFAHCWEKKPLIIRQSDNARKSLETLFSRKILDDILRHKDVQYGLHVNACRYVGGQRENLSPDGGKATAKRVWQLFDTERATLQFHQPQQHQDNIWHLCAALEAYFGCLVGSNIYMTPPESQGLAPHHDDVEVFIIQLEGCKHWRLYEPLTRLAYTPSHDFSTAEIGEPTHDFVLKTGDVLYFPRGTIHQADTPAGSGHSTHITISTYQQWCYADLLQAVLPSALESVMNNDVQFRRGLPRQLLSRAGTASGPYDQSLMLCENLSKLTHRLADKLAQDVTRQCVDLLHSDFVGNRLPPPLLRQSAAGDVPPKKRKKVTEGSASNEPVSRAPCSVDDFVRLLYAPGYLSVIIAEKPLARPTTEEGEDEDDDEKEEEEVEEEDEDDDNIPDLVPGLVGSSSGLVNEKEEEEEEQEDVGEEDKEDEEECLTDEEWCFVHHCLTNDRQQHMISAALLTQPPSVLKLPVECYPGLCRIMEFYPSKVQLSSLNISPGHALQLATSLWAEGLLTVINGR